jgi:adenylate cyclase
MQLGLRSAHRSGTGRIAFQQRIRLAGAGVGALLCLGVVTVYLSWRKPVPPQCGHASIAVLPFANLSGDPAQDCFSDGTTEDIIAALGHFSDLSVIARVAVQKYKGQPLQLDELNRNLGVCYALEGSVRRNGDQVLVTAQFLDAVAGRFLWSESHEGDLKDLFAVRNQITQNVVGRRPELRG